MNTIIERDYQFVSTAHWPQLQTMMPGLFKNPLHRDTKTYAVTFAEAEVYIPRARYRCCPWATSYPCVKTINGVQIRTTCYNDHYDNWPGQWDLFNQNWTTRLVPATAANLPTILQTHPQNYVTGLLSGYQAPTIGLSSQAFNLVNTH